MRKSHETHFALFEASPNPPLHCLEDVARPILHLLKHPSIKLFIAVPRKNNALRLNLTLGCKSDMHVVECSTTCLWEGVFFVVLQRRIRMYVREAD